MSLLLLCSNRIACVSCPTLFSKLMSLKPPDCHIILLEYDRRFEIHGNHFVFYDYNEPLTLPETLQKDSYDLVIADPPFLSEECLQKTAETIKFLAKEKILLCTGNVSILHAQPSWHETKIVALCLWNVFREFAVVSRNMSTLAIVVMWA